MAGFYNWRRVAERTVRVYDDVTASAHNDSTLARLRRAFKCVANPADIKTNMQYYDAAELRFLNLQVCRFCNKMGSK